MTSLLLVWGVWVAPLAAGAEKPREMAALAKSVPPDARLFLEFSDIQTFMKSRAGQEFVDLLTGLVPAPATQPTSQPADGWPHVLGEKLGLHDDRAARLLFSGRLALAADGWNEINEVVLLAEPADPAALEKELQAVRIPATASSPVRHYRLAANHELACDGRTVVAGRRSPKPGGLYMRTVSLWATGRRVALADLAEFRERTTTLPAESHIVFYSGSERSAPTTQPSGSAILWPDLKSLAVGVVMNGRAVTVETSARLAEASMPEAADPPSDSLLRVPASTLVAWTRPIRYVEEFKRIEASYPDGPIRFYLEVLQNGLPAGTLESRLLKHLVGDSILMVGQQPVVSPGEPPGRPLLLPVIGLAIETDDPDAVAGVLARMTENLLGLLNLQPPAGGPLVIREMPIAPDGPVIRSVAIGRFLATQTAGEILASVEISWTVADRWLIVATHPEMVRQIVEVRRGQAEAVGVGGFQQALARVKGRSSTPQMALIARPVAAAAVIDSWIDYLGRRHPDMLKPDWWQRLRRQQLANSVQLGIVPKPTTQPGVLVDRTWVGWPAHERLQPGDLITGVDAKEVDPKDPMTSLRGLIANRQRPQFVSLKIMRSGREMRVPLPMLADAADWEPIRPFELLANLADLLRVFSSASYITWQPTKDLVNARLELELGASAPPASVPSLVTIGPATAPATASAPSPVMGPAQTAVPPGSAPAVAPATQPPATTPAK